MHTARPRKPKESKLGQAERRTGPLTVPGTLTARSQASQGAHGVGARMDTDYDPDPIAGRLPEEVRSGNDSVHALFYQPLAEHTMAWASNSSGRLHVAGSVLDKDVAYQPQGLGTR